MMRIEELKELIDDDIHLYCYHRFKTAIKCPYCNEPSDGILYNMYSQFIYWYIHEKDGKAC